MSISSLPDLHSYKDPDFELYVTNCSSASLCANFLLVGLYCTTLDSSASLALVRVRKEHSSFPPRPSTLQNYWLRYGTCAKRTLFFSTQPFHHEILLAPVRVRAMWRWSSSMQLQQPSPSISTPPFHHTNWLRYVCEKNTVLFHPALPPSLILLAPVRVREEHRSSPPCPSTITNTAGSGACARRTQFFPTPPFHHKTEPVALMPLTLRSGLGCDGPYS